MWRTFQALFTRCFDLLLPRKDRVMRLDAYRIESLPVQPELHVMGSVHITTLMAYREKTVEDMIRALKYDRAPKAVSLLSDALADYLREEIERTASLSTLPILLVPVPLHTNRERNRGFNQIAEVLRALPAEFHDGTLSRVAPALIRTRHTSPQTHLSRKKRLTNVKDAFALTHPDLARNAHVILIDDVTTTGSTLNEAARPLRGHAASVTLLALAHA